MKRPVICPICYQGLARPFRARAIGPGGRLQAFPALIHYCPSIQPDPANDPQAGGLEDPSDRNE